MSTGYYKLAGKIPIACDDVIEFSRWFETANRIVQQEDVGKYFVSTIFLGIDHNFEAIGQPLLFESAVFTRGEEKIFGKMRRTLTDHNMERTPTWELALEAHARAVAWAEEHAHDNR